MKVSATSQGLKRVGYMEQELITIAVLCFFAIVGGIIAKRFKQPTVLGLLLIGALVGPNTLGFVSNQEWIDMIIEIGAILLLFMIGLEFDLTKLIKVGFKGILISILKVGIAFFIGFEAATLLGFSSLVGIFAGAIISFSSTVVIIKVLEEKALYNRQETPLLLTMLIIEDILAVIALIFFSGLQNTTQTSMLDMAEHLIIGLTTLLIVYSIMLFVSKLLFKWVLKEGSDDVTTFLALGFCGGFSVLAYVLGLSPSAGAFLAGSIIASLPQAKSFEHAVKPYSTSIGSLFFIAMGTMVNFSNIKPNLTFILVLFGAVILSRFIAVGLVSYVFAGFKGDQIFFASLAMISVGEFALLIAKLGSGFNMGIDIVTITSVIIFGTALFMSLSVAYSKGVNNVWSYAKTPESLSNGFSHLAWYVRSFFDHVDTENSETKRFKNAFFSTCLTVLFLAYAVVGWDKTLGLAYTFEVAGYWNYVIHSAFAILGLLIMYIIARKISYTRETLLHVMTSMDRMMNHKKSQKILTNLCFVAVFFVSALFFPLVIYVADLPVWTNYICFVLLGVSFVYFKMTSKILSTYRSSSYTNAGLYRSVKITDLYKPKQLKI
jgi:Kef-type K+ transport system membrane component KefB